MTPVALLRNPQTTIAAQLASDPNAWSIPMLGYFFLSLAEGHDGMATRLAGTHPAIVILASLTLAATVGVALGSLSFGGALHLGARLFGGQPGLGASVQAVGYGLFWPGLIAAPAAVALSFTGETYPAATCAIALVNVAAGIWALYTTVAAIRVRHRFRWWRAILAYLVPLFALGLVALLLLVVLRS